MARRPHAVGLEHDIFLQFEDPEIDHSAIPTADQATQLRSHIADRKDGKFEMANYRCKNPVPAMSDFGPQTLVRYMRYVAEQDRIKAVNQNVRSQPHAGGRRSARLIELTPTRSNAQTVVDPDYVGPVTRRRTQVDPTGTSQPLPRNDVVVSHDTTINNGASSIFTSTAKRVDDLTNTDSSTQQSTSIDNLPRGVKRIKLQHTVDSSSKRVRESSDQDLLSNPFSSSTKSDQSLSRSKAVLADNTVFDKGVGSYPVPDTNSVDQSLTHANQKSSLTPGQIILGPARSSSTMSQAGDQDVAMPNCDQDQTSASPQSAQPVPSSRSQDQTLNANYFLSNTVDKAEAEVGRSHSTTREIATRGHGQQQEHMPPGNVSQFMSTQPPTAAIDNSHVSVTSSSNTVDDDSQVQDDPSDSDAEKYRFAKVGCKCPNLDYSHPLTHLNYDKVNVDNNAFHSCINLNLKTQRRNPNYLPAFPAEIWAIVKQHLSVQEIRSLRLVNKATAEQLAPHLWRSVVVKYGRDMFGVPCQDCDTSQIKVLPSNSMVRHYGHLINKFGISFEFDQDGLSYAPKKNLNTIVNAWFGSYTWPAKTFPRNPAFTELEDLAENNQCALLKATLINLTNVSELALSLDSGHGWLNGPDISDLALYELRRNGGEKVFGRTFLTEDTLFEIALRQYFTCAQTNTIRAVRNHIRNTHSSADKTRKLTRVEKMSIREYDDYQDPANQLETNAHVHTGGLSARRPPPAIINPAQNFYGPVNLNPNLPHAQLNAALIQNVPARTNGLWQPTQRPLSTNPQWPIIFNGYNLAAEFGGDSNWAQEFVARPGWFPYHPGRLTESQVSYLMEQAWAQRTFLTAFTTSLSENAIRMQGVHSLVISRLSSGLLGSLSNSVFWNSLPKLTNLTLMVIPDWRREYVPGDKKYLDNMPISPVDASRQLVELLINHVVPIENLSKLTTGFVGGGEHGIGLFARNDHVLPAPITREPAAWLTTHRTTPDAKSIITFNHIRELKFENCWFSPPMLEQFLVNSRDTSLHHLILDSVSLTGVHSARTAQLTTIDDDLRCEFGQSAWLHERLPDTACWARVLDKVTPGKTFLDHKIEAKMVEANTTYSEFRGNLEQISLKSCGYVKISGCTNDTFNQNGVIQHKTPSDIIDEGLSTRKYQFRVHDAALKTIIDQSEQQEVPGHFGYDNNQEHIMMAANNPANDRPWWGLGKLTSCVHPVEKRVLEMAWGLVFGWGDDMGRWRAVEDGCWEGGTGRFSGVVGKE